RLKRFLIKAGYRVTTMDASGAHGPVEILFSIIRRRQLARVERVIRRCSPRAFYTIEDVRFASGPEPLAGRFRGRPQLRSLISRRKGK
ncbi:MAG: DUF2179 domain-containing protein, partial [Candidatus Eisenbacteria bacterium]|nr:DUF2179 domain-containing protein [Candidatus Eisenbacteria bacterium]